MSVERAPALPPEVRARLANERKSLIALGYKETPPPTWAQPRKNVLGYFQAPDGAFVLQTFDVTAFGHRDNPKQIEQVQRAIRGHLAEAQQQAKHDPQYVERMAQTYRAMLVLEEHLYREIKPQVVAGIPAGFVGIYAPPDDSHRVVFYLDRLIVAGDEQAKRRVADILNGGRA